MRSGSLLLYALIFGLSLALGFLLFLLLWPNRQPEPATFPPQIFYPTLDSLNKVQTLADKLRYLYNVEEDAYVTDSDLPLARLAAADLHTSLYGAAPKILIFHTHSQESYIGAGPGKRAGVADVGDELARILVRQYGVSVLHDTGVYDMVNGAADVNGSYERMEAAVSRLLAQYPSVEVLLDLHRDALPGGARLITEINGKPTAQLMLVNGVTCLSDSGRPRTMPDLVNPYLRENLAFSLQTQLIANERYPGLMRRIYLKPYRYSLNLRPKSLLVEVGTDTNTLEEAENAMGPLARILVEVLSGDRGQ